MSRYEVFPLVILILTICAIDRAASWSTGRDLLFNKFGELGFKQYFIPKYQKVHWHEARALCEQFGMEYARFELAAEMAYIQGVMASYGAASYYLYVDGVATVLGQTTGWYWTKSRVPIDYPLVWLTVVPENTGGDQACLSLVKLAGGVIKVDDVSCFASANNIAFGPQLFLCQIVHENFIHRIINGQGK